MEIRCARKAKRGFYPYLYECKEFPKKPHWIFCNKDAKAGRKEEAIPKTGERSPETGFTARSKTPKYGKVIRNINKTKGAL
jgi:hypothetical protein